MLQPNDYALVMGVDDYEKQPLKGPTRDATLFARWLTDKQSGGGLPDENCYLVINPDSPVGSMVTITLEKIVIQVERAREEGRLPRRFYLYFSGHGQSAQFSDIYLCMKLWAPTRPLSLSSTKCSDEMINCCNFQEVAIFLDCCRTATTSVGFQPGLGCGQTPSSRDSGMPGTSIFQAYSSEHLAPSYEGEVAHRSGASPSFGGFFTHALLGALYGCAADPAGGVRPEALRNYLEQEVPRLAAQQKRDVQKPQINIGFSPDSIFGCALPKSDNEKANTRLTEEKSNLQVSFHFPSSINPLDIQIAVYNKASRQIYLGQAPINLEVPKGKYVVQWSYPGVLSEIEVNVPQKEPREILIKRSTPIPAPGSAHQHEYYSCMDQTILSDEKTGSPANHLQSASSRLYILMRARNRESYRGEDLTEGLELLDENLTPLFSLKEYSQFDQQYGSLLCSLPYAPGYYFLRYLPGNNSIQARLFPIHIFAGWQSRLFFFHEYGQLDFMNSSMSLLPLDYHHYDPVQFKNRQRVDTAVELALAVLQKKSEQIPHTISQSWQDQSIKNPLLAMLQAHFLLKNTSNSESRTILFSILQYLKDSLPTSPDVLALQYWAHLCYPDDINFNHPNKSVRNVPILRASQQILLQAGLVVDTIESKSVLENLSPYLYLDTPWATFRPIERKPAASRQDRPGTDSEEFQGDITRNGEYDSDLEINFSIPSDRIVYDEVMGGKGDSWLSETLKEIIQLSEITGQELDWKNLSLELGIPLRKLILLREDLQK